MLEKRLVQHVADSAADTELSEIEKAEQVLKRGGEPHKIGSQTVEEYLSGEERQNQCQEVENQVDAGVKQAFLNP